MISPSGPVWGTPESWTASVVVCGSDGTHMASRETFEDVGGCPYCVYTQGERMAAVQARSALARRHKAEIRQIRGEYEALLAAERAERQRLERDLAAMATT